MLTKHQCKEGHAWQRRMFLTGSICFPPDRRRECYRTLSTSSRSAAFSWDSDFMFDCDS